MLEVLQKGGGAFCIGNKYRMCPHRLEPVHDSRKTLRIDRKAERAQGGEIGKPRALDDPGGLKRPGLRARAKHLFEAVEDGVDVPLACFEKTRRRLVVAIGPAPI